MCQQYGPGCPLPPLVTHADLGNSLASRKLCTLGICSPGASISLSFYLLPFLSRCSAEEVFGDGGRGERISNLNLSCTCHWFPNFVGESLESPEHLTCHWTAPSPVPDPRCSASLLLLGASQIFTREILGAAATVWHGVFSWFFFFFSFFSSFIWVWRTCHSRYSRNRVKCILEVNTAARRPWRGGHLVLVTGRSGGSVPWLFWGVLWGCVWKSLVTVCKLNGSLLCFSFLKSAWRENALVWVKVVKAKPNSYNLSESIYSDFSPFLLPLSTSKCHNYWRMQFWQQQVLAYGWKQSTGERCGRLGPIYTLALCFHSQASWKSFGSAGCSLVLHQGLARHTGMMIKIRVSGLMQILKDICVTVVGILDGCHWMLRCF